MRHFSACTLALTACIAWALPAPGQPPDERGPGRPGRFGGPPGGRPDGPPDRSAPPHGRGGGAFEPGKLLPPHVRDGLDLSDDQQEQLDRLEKEVKGRLMKILSTEQRKTLRELCAQRPGRDAGPNQREMRRGPGGPPPGGRRPGGPGPGAPGGPGGPGEPAPGGPPDRDNPPK